MSNTVSVASDVVVPYNCQVGSGQKVSTQSAGAEVSVAFSETAPLAKVREELEGEAGTVTDALVIDLPDTENVPEDTTNPLVAFLGSTGEYSEVGQYSKVFTGQGGNKQNSETTVSETEIDVSAILVDDISMTPGITPTNTSEPQAGIVAIEGQSDISETSSMPSIKAYSDEVLDDQAPFPVGGVSISGSDKSGVEEGGLGNHPDQPLSSTVNQDQIPATVVVDSTPKIEVGQADYTTGINTQGDTSVQVVSNKEIVGDVDATDITIDSDVLKTGNNDQSFEVAVVAESDAMSPSTQASSANQAGNAPEGVPNGMEVNANTIQGEPVNGEVQAEDLRDSGANSVTESEPVVQMKQDTQVVESNRGDTQVASNVYRQLSDPEKTDSANEPQIAPGESISRANSGEVVTERPKNEVDVPQSSPVSIVSGDSEAPSAPTGNPQNPTIASGESDRILQISEQSEGAIRTGSQENADTISEISTQAQEVQATVSQRTVDPLWSSSEAETAAFKSSAGTVSEQIADSVQVSLGRGEKEIVIRLNPPELGSVAVRLEEKDGGIVGVLEVGRIETRREIEQALPQVIQSLQEAGVQVRRLDLTVAAQPDKDFGREQLQQDASGQQSKHRQGERAESWYDTDYATPSLFQQGMTGSMVSGESLSDWSQDRIDMLV